MTLDQINSLILIALSLQPTYPMSLNMVAKLMSSRKISKRSLTKLITTPLSENLSYSMLVIRYFSDLEFTYLKKSNKLNV